MPTAPATAEPTCRACQMGGEACWNHRPAAAVSDPVADRLQAAGLPYEITDVAPTFLMSGGRAVVACYTRGSVSRLFTGFYGADEDAAPIAAAKAIHGVHTVYVVASVEA